MQRSPPVLPAPRCLAFGPSCQSPGDYFTTRLFFLFSLDHGVCPRTRKTRNLSSSVAARQDEGSQTFKFLTIEMLRPAPQDGSIGKAL